MTPPRKRGSYYKSLTLKKFQDGLGLRGDIQTCQRIREGIRKLARKHFDYGVPMKDQSEETWERYEQEVCTEEPMFLSQPQRDLLRRYTRRFMGDEICNYTRHMKRAAALDALPASNAVALSPAQPSLNEHKLDNCATVTPNIPPSLDSRPTPTISGKKLFHLNPVEDADSASLDRAVMRAPGF